MWVKLWCAYVYKWDYRKSYHVTFYILLNWLHNGVVKWAGCYSLNGPQRPSVGSWFPKLCINGSVSMMVAECRALGSDWITLAHWGASSTRNPGDFLRERPIDMKHEYAPCFLPGHPVILPSVLGLLSPWYHQVLPDCGMWTSGIERTFS